MNKNYFLDYFNDLNSKIQDVNFEEFREAINFFSKTHQKNGKIIVAGNGGSAAIASHVTVDFTKAARIRAINFNEPSLITCFSNDFGYEFWLENAIKFYAEPVDSVVLISSSGQSPNIINAAKYAKRSGLPVITFSGFKGDNPLRSIGDVNFWVSSKSYNLIEMTHQAWLLAMIDFLINQSNIKNS